MREHYVALVTTTPSLHAATRELATRLAGRANAVLLFLHVTPIRPSDGEAMLYGALDLASGEAEAWLRTQLPTDPTVRHRYRVEAGDPEEVVAQFVREHQVELVVVEEPPRRWISESLWRGQAERLIRRVDCPVVIGGPGFLRSAPPVVAPVRPRLDDTTVAGLLNAMVDARVEALRRWMDHAADAVRRIAASTTVRMAVSQAGRSNGVLDRATEERLKVELDEHVRALRAVGWQLTLGPRSWGPQSAMPPASSALADFLMRVHSQGQSSSIPLELTPDAGQLVILSAATIEEKAVLLLSFDADADFLRILGQPGPLPSFETYAFDKHGWMLSNSRFPDHLLATGLLPEGLQTPLRLRVAEPSDAPVDDWTLTLSVRQAILRKDGFNTRGYRDYRGTPVVGAWRWIPEYDFGVAAEVDLSAAYPR